MVGEDVGKLALVLRLEEFLNRAFGKFGKGLVGGGEDRERSFPFERFNKICGAESGGERLE